MSSQQQDDFAPAARLILVLGGARSGKSTFAERMAKRSGRSVAFIATATAGDDEEMRERIKRHRAARPHEWHTIEEQLRLAEAVRRAARVADVLLLDCVTVWLANWMIAQGVMSELEKLETVTRYSEGALAQIESLLAELALLDERKTLVAVTNEVGLGIVPPYPLGRIYRDVLGTVNQRLASASDRVYLMVAGLAVDIKGLSEEATL